MKSVFEELKFEKTLFLNGGRIIATEDERKIEFRTSRLRGGKTSISSLAGDDTALERVANFEGEQASRCSHPCRSPDKLVGPLPLH